MIFGRGDAILKYPELIDSLDAAALDMIDYAKRVPYVAVHLGASEEKKTPPSPEKLIEGLRNAGVPFMLVGKEFSPLPPNFRLHVEFVRNARKFIGTLSVFNVVAQVLKVPSFVLVNRSIKEPLIYSMMLHNQSWISPWNTGASIDGIYAEAIQWAKS